ncbi:hypothetical protein VD0003_g8882, partial [Verticillium dahliae]
AFARSPPTLSLCR